MEPAASEPATSGKGPGRRLAELLRTGLRRALYPLLALPASLVGLVLMLAGQTRATAALHRQLSRHLLDVPVPAPSRAATVAYTLVSLPANLIGSVPAGYLWAVLLLNLGYPLRPDTTAQSLETAWGGPTLAGAWAVHALGGLALFLLVGLPVLSAVAWLQAWLVRRMLGITRPAPPR